MGERLIVCNWNFFIPFKRWMNKIKCQNVKCCPLVCLSFWSVSCCCRLAAMTVVCGCQSLFVSILIYELLTVPLCMSANLLVLCACICLRTCGCRCVQFSVVCLCVWTLHSVMPVRVSCGNGTATKLTFVPADLHLCLWRSLLAYANTSPLCYKQYSSV